jgi:hypothetical protein
MASEQSYSASSNLHDHIQMRAMLMKQQHFHNPKIIILKLQDVEIHKRERGSNGTKQKTLILQKGKDKPAQVPYREKAQVHYSNKTKNKCAKKKNNP